MPVTNKQAPFSGNAGEDTNEDRRIRRTKRALKKAVLDLISEKGYDDVSVQEILDRADVGRTSFYTYFKSKEDLLLKSLDDFGDLLNAFGDFITQKPEGADDEHSSPFDFPLMFFQHLGENRSLARAILGRNIIPVAREKVQNQFLEYFRRMYRETSSGKAGELQIETAAVFSAGALLAVTQWWLSPRKAPATPEQMNEQLQRLIPR